MDTITEMRTADEVYETSVRPMVTSEQLKLAARILNEISPTSSIDYDDDWSDEDLRQVTEYTLRRFYEENPTDDDLV